MKNETKKSSERSPKQLPRMTRRLFVYLILFVIAQVGIGLFCISYFRISPTKNLVDKKLSVKSKFVDFPPNYKPPCQINAKEALSALNR